MPENNSPLSATELAEMGFCERKVFLKAKYGERVTDEQIHARSRGHAVHEAAYREKHVSKDSRCYVASCVYGPDAIETNMLRAWRDDFLLPSRSGRWFVDLYYALSPFVIRVAGRNKTFHFVAKSIIDMLLKKIEKS